MIILFQVFLTLIFFVIVVLGISLVNAFSSLSVTNIQQLSVPGTSNFGGKIYLSTQDIDLH
jgi:hypothetical protein